jgi:hypothetical protein
MNKKAFIPFVVLALLVGVYSTAWAAPDWDITGTWDIVFTCTSGCGGDWLHTMQVTVFDLGTGDFTGTGFYVPNPGYTWDAVGNVTGSSVSFKITYTGINAGYWVQIDGSIATDGSSMSGTAASSYQTFTWVATGQATPTVVEVDIDIKPGSDPNCFNSDEHGVIPVAILGSSTFDASTIDPFSVSLDGAGVRIRGKSGNAGSLDDVNGDGYLDLIIQIIDEGTYSAGDTWATLSGMAGGREIAGGDAICIRP